MHHQCHHNRQICECYICGNGRQDCILFDDDRYATDVNSEELNTPIFTATNLDNNNGIGTPESILDGSRFTGSRSDDNNESIRHPDSDPYAQVFHSISTWIQQSPDMDGLTGHYTNNNTPPKQPQIPRTIIRELEIDPIMSNPGPSSADSNNKCQQPTDADSNNQRNTGHIINDRELVDNSDASSKIPSRQPDSFVFDYDNRRSVRRMHESSPTDTLYGRNYRRSNEPGNNGDRNIPIQRSENNSDGSTGNSSAAEEAQNNIYSAEELQVVHILRPHRQPQWTLESQHQPRTPPTHLHHHRPPEPHPHRLPVPLYQLQHQYNSSTIMPILGL